METADQTSSPAVSAPATSNGMKTNPVNKSPPSQKDGVLLQGIIEANETYIDGKPRKPNKRQDFEPSKWERGRDKIPVIGAVESGSKVVAQVAENLIGLRILEFIRSVVNFKDSELITDEFQAYELVGKEVKHPIINHQEQFVGGDAHTNTIEGFWSLLKWAWYGQHCHYQIGYTPLYVTEGCYKYNYGDMNIFRKFFTEFMRL